jgi:hypothetical protein
MRRIASRTVLIPVLLAALALSGGPAEAAKRGSDSREKDIAEARLTLVDLLASERIERIDFEAETYEEAMNLLHAAADAILLENLGDFQETRVLVDRASQVIEGFNVHKPRGMLLTFGKNPERVAVRDPREARILGEMLGRAVTLIREEYGVQGVSYRDKSIKLFRSVILNVEEGSLLVQYADGIERIEDLPRTQRARYFE